MFADLVFSKLAFFEQGLHTSVFQGSPLMNKRTEGTKDKGQQRWRGESSEELGVLVEPGYVAVTGGGGTLNSAEGTPEQVLGDQGRCGFTPCVGSH